MRSGSRTRAGGAVLFASTVFHPAPVCRGDRAPFDHIIVRFLVVVSPYAERAVVAHGQYDHASILKLIERRFGLAPLTDRDRRAAAFLEAFDFSQPPRPPVTLP